MLVQPLNLDDTPRGAAFLAVDGVGAGVHEKVLVVLEGRAAGEALGKRGAPVDAAIIGIIDTGWRKMTRTNADWPMTDQELRGDSRRSLARPRSSPPLPDPPAVHRRARQPPAPAARARRRRRWRLHHRAVGAVQSLRLLSVAGTLARGSAVPGQVGKPSIRHPRHAPLPSVWLAKLSAVADVDRAPARRDAGRTNCGRASPTRMPWSAC